MEIKELTIRLSDLGVENEYSLDGTMIPDRYILKQTDGKWTFFYLDDHGKIDTVDTNTPLIRVFGTESEACDYIAKLAEEEVGKRARRIQDHMAVYSDRMDGARIIHNYLKEIKK